MLTLKKTMTLGATIALALGFAAGTAQAATTNGFANGGFEDATPYSPLPPGGVTSFAANWLSAPTGNPVTLSNDARTGLHSALVSSPNGFGGSTLFQNSIDHGGLPVLTVGDTPTLSFWWKGDVSTTGNALFSLRYLDGIGNILYNSGNVFFAPNGSSAQPTWKEVTFAGGVVPAGAKAAFIEINSAVGPLLDGRPNAILVDDLYLGVAAAVPEPETYALMLAGLAGLGAMVRRRRV